MVSQTPPASTLPCIKDVRASPRRHSPRLFIYSSPAWFVGKLSIRTAFRHQRLVGQLEALTNGTCMVQWKAIDAAQRDDIAYGKRTLPHRRDGQRFVRARRPGYACTCRKAEEMLHGPPPMLRAVPPV